MDMEEIQDSDLLIFAEILQQIRVNAMELFPEFLRITGYLKTKDTNFYIAEVNEEEITFSHSNYDDIYMPIQFACSKNFRNDFEKEIEEKKLKKLQAENEKIAKAKSEQEKREYAQFLELQKKYGNGLG